MRIDDPIIELIKQTENNMEDDKIRLEELF
jgi:hypothetical protein